MSKILKNKYKIIILISIAVGIIVRVACISMYPNALNVDEASSGYDAYSILNYGIDRNGNFFPVYLEAWGSGQSVAYAILSIPFIKIFGLNTFSIRIPMAIIGCISLIIMYKIVKRINNKTQLAIVVILFAISPWHIMKSRWGMDCNIFPDVILYAVYFFIKFLDTKQYKYIYIASVILALSSYTYATSFFFLPIFVSVIFIYLLIKKQITIKSLIISVIIMFIIALPMLLYVIINTFKLSTLNFIITIPRLPENRYEELSSIFNGKSSRKNFMDSLIILIKQEDSFKWNTFPIYGIDYVISLPFIFLGMIICIKKKNQINWIFNIWFIASTLLLFVIEPNINRINIIMIPIIYYTAIGISEIFEHIQLSKIFIPIIYIGLFISFEISYFITDWNQYYTFNNKVENVIKYAKEKEKVYFEYSFKEPYIYVCFYNKVDPNIFYNTVKYKNNIKGFDTVESFDKYYFYIPEKKENNATYIIRVENEKNYDFKNEEWKKEYIDNFVVIHK